jgi:hypothetical protein
MAATVESETNRNPLDNFFSKARKTIPLDFYSPKTRHPRPKLQGVKLCLSIIRYGGAHKNIPT